MGFPNGQPPPVPDTESARRAWLLCHYLTIPAVFRNGHQTKWIDPSGEGEALDILQTDLRRRMGQIGISVEVNPSSNLLIGNLGEFEQHPLWRLRRHAATTRTTSSPGSRRSRSASVRTIR